MQFGAAQNFGASEKPYLVSDYVGCCWRRWKRKEGRSKEEGRGGSKRHMKKDVRVEGNEKKGDCEKEERDGREYVEWRKRR